MRESLFQNILAIENTLYKSETFKYLKDTGLEKEAIAAVAAEIFKQAITGAISLEELELRNKNESLAYEKARMEMELSILSAKAQIKVAQAEAIKSLIQAKSMVRSVVDNAAIQRSNGYVGLANVIGNASEQSALTNPDMSGGTTGGIASLAAENIEKINVSPINDFDNLLKSLINDDKFISKDVMIYAPKQIIPQGEYIVLEGISSFAKNDSEFLLGNEQVAINKRNYIFHAKDLGDFIVTFAVKNDENTWVKDTITLKVIQNNTLKEHPPIKKY